MREPLRLDRFRFFGLKESFGALRRLSLLVILLQGQRQLSQLCLDLDDSSLDIRLLDGAQLDIQQRAQARGDSGMKFAGIEVGDQPCDRISNGGCDAFCCFAVDTVSIPFIC